MAQRVRLSDKPRSSRHRSGDSSEAPTDLNNAKGRGDEDEYKGCIFILAKLKLTQSGWFRGGNLGWGKQQMNLLAAVCITLFHF